MWDRYWFFPELLQRLGVCRLLAFWLLIADLVYFTNFAWVFHKKIDRIFWEPILLLRVLHRVFGVGPPSQQTLELIFIVTLILAVGAFIGYRTRVCTLGASVLYM